ncbi:MAG: DUF1501 domain-containing protein [Planctomycetales bacterium]
MRLGLTGMAGLTLPQLFQLRAQAAAKPPAERTALILVWLRGGGSHLEMWDPKPLAGSEYQGPFGPIDTNIPGLQFGELLPRQARLADKFTILRSMAHTGGGHPSGSLQLLTGDPDPLDKPKPIYPDVMTVAHYLRHNKERALPNFVGVNAITNYDNFQIAGSAYLGSAFDPFNVLGDPNDPHFEVPNLSLANPDKRSRLMDSINLKKDFDRLERLVDQRGTMQALDQFEAQALRMLVNPETRQAFDIQQEPEQIREKYGRNRWGQQCLLARRLVEAGVELITTTFDGPLCGRVANWDDHAVNHHVFDALKFRLPVFDQAVSALIEDIFDRGLDKRVLVIVTGEFGRTPRISYQPSSGGGVASAPVGVTQPGRDHWPNANSMMFFGGNIFPGQVIGGTDRRGEEVIERRFGPQDFLATIYHHLGIDAQNIALQNFAGRPIPLLNGGQPIPELAPRGSA